MNPNRWGELCRPLVTNIMSYWFSLSSGHFLSSFCSLVLDNGRDLECTKLFKLFFSCVRNHCRTADKLDCENPHQWTPVHTKKGLQFAGDSTRRPAVCSSCLRPASNSHHIKEEYRIHEGQNLFLIKKENTEFNLFYKYNDWEWGFLSYSVISGKNEASPRCPRQQAFCRSC